MWEGLMRKMALAALTAFGFSQAAVAADMPVKAPAPAVVAAYNWSGFYIGVQGGYGWGHHDRSLLPPGTFANSYDSRGALIGVYGGYNWQWTNVVAGIEADYNWSGVKGDDGGVGGTVDETMIRGVGTVRCRIGIAYNQALFFIT